MRILRILLSFSVTACLQLAVASTIVEYDRATFQTALSGATLSGQNFDSLPLGTITTVDGVTFTPSLGTALVTDEFETTTSPNGLGSTSDGFFDPTESLSITFSTPITAFAIDINTFASQSGDYEAAVNDVSESLISSVFDTFPNSETGQFIGFTDSSPFTSILITGVPDPGTGNGFCGTSPLCSYGGFAGLWRRIGGCSGLRNSRTVHICIFGNGNSCRWIFRATAKQPFSIAMGADPRAGTHSRVIVSE